MVRKKGRQTNFKYPITSPVKFTLQERAKVWWKLLDRIKHAPCRRKKTTRSETNSKLTSANKSVCPSNIGFAEDEEDSNQMTFAEPGPHAKDGRGNETGKVSEEKSYANELTVRRSKTTRIKVCRLLSAVKQYKFSHTSPSTEVIQDLYHLGLV